MPAYNFKSQFAEPVATGQKRQTIRPQRKRPTQLGDHLKLYTGLLTEATCLDVMPVTIGYDYVDWGALGFARTNSTVAETASLLSLAQADGFEAAETFFEFFRTQYGVKPGEPLVGMEIIKW